MSFARKVEIVIVMLLGVAAGVWAQRRGGMGPQAPQMPLGLFKAVAGSGAQYEMQAKDQTMTFAYVILGKEVVDGKEGNWIEIRTEGGRMPGETVMKQLTVVDEGKAEVKRMIMQAPGRPPMEMPVGMMSGMMRQQQQPAAESKAGGMGEKVGTESVTVPAGTYECDHYRKEIEGGKTADYWISTKVLPYGVVKMTSPDMTMVLKKTLSNETSHIKGEPQKMEMPHF